MLSIPSANTVLCSIKALEYYFFSFCAAFAVSFWRSEIDWPAPFSPRSALTYRRHGMISLASTMKVIVQYVQHSRRRSPTSRSTGSVQTSGPLAAVALSSQSLLLVQHCLSMPSVRRPSCNDLQNQRTLLRLLASGQNSAALE